MFEIVTIFANLLCFVGGIFASFRSRDKSIKLFAIYFLVCLIFNIIVAVLGSHGINSIFTFHFLPLIELLLLIRILFFWDSNFVKVYITIGVVVGIEILFDSIFTPLDQVPFESLLVQKVVLAILFARLMIIYDSIDLKQVKYLLIIAMTIDFSAGTVQIMFFVMKLNMLPLTAYPIMYMISLLIAAYALFLEYWKNRSGLVSTKA